MHPEKIAGTEIITTSYEFPITIKGTKEDIIKIVTPFPNKKQITFEEYYSKIRFYKSGGIDSYQEPDEHKGMSKKDNIDWFKNRYLKYLERNNFNESEDEMQLEFEMLQLELEMLNSSKLGNLDNLDKLIRYGNCDPSKCETLTGIKGNACCKKMEPQTLSNGVTYYNLKTCEFLENGECSVYDLRPCYKRGFPIIPEELKLVKNCGYSFINLNEKI